ncbi:ATP-binding cassette domain-containing protein [Breoghania sp.]|uniref:ATP-binding cassette domain-containing protein n=1 Tax=Breoghania sp. TaxID=2065378 RepID=UPI00262FBD07|nr:ATP-binding cassette domain-containing protein [Breoghania sp.]MDJ0930733.1 ATP-binding cassette domain-containing protein [Breoghania sp.]
MANIQLQTVTKAFDPDVYGVKDVDLTIEDGEFICFLGPSGCGKSTTLLMIAGLEDVTSGRILIGDRDMTRTARSQRRGGVPELCALPAYECSPEHGIRTEDAWPCA